MRLTLRTLLAYLDEMLEPADSADLAKKIDESEFATQLMHRVRDVPRRLRLGAPKVDGRGLGLDPNTVAEYLDNTLPDERIADFEKVCLESDVHLAEVAATHQILTLVLGEPAEIDPAARRHMYGLLGSPTAADATAAEGAAAAAAGAAIAEVASSPKVRGHRRRRPHVPNYLREGEPPVRRGRWLKRFAAVLLIALVGGTIAAMMFPPAPKSKVAEDSRKDARLASTAGLPNDAAATKHADKTSKASGDNADSDKTDGHKSDAAALTGDAADATASDDATERADAVRPNDIAAMKKSATHAAAAAIAADAASNDKSPAPGTTPDDGERTVPAPPLGKAPGANPERPLVETSTNPLRSTTANATTKKEMPADAAKVADDSLPAAPLPPDDVPGAVKTPKTDATLDVGARTAAAVAAAAKAGPVAEGIGRLVSDHEVVLRWDGDKKTWTRLPLRESVTAGDVLQGLPTYRPSIALGSGVMLQLAGGARVELTGVDADGVPGFKLLDGRLVVLAVGRQSKAVHVTIGDRDGLVTFGDPDSSFALSLRRQLPDGADPQTDKPIVTAELYATSRSIHWRGSDGADVELLAPGVLPLDGRPAPKADAKVEIPDWVSTDRLSQLEKQASVFIEENLKSDRAVSLSLKELVEHRKEEHRALAALCLAQIDEFESMIPILNDPEQRALKNWSGQVQALRDAMARSPETAAKVEQAFVQLKGQNGKEMYRMLRGYTDDELRKGAAADLVARLANDELDIRVLAFWNLLHATGTGLNYQPHMTLAQRQSPLLKWRQKLETGQIAPAKDDVNTTPVKSKSGRTSKAARPAPATPSAPPVKDAEKS